jgi:hypothetical protein
MPIDKKIKRDVTNDQTIATNCGAIVESVFSQYVCCASTGQGSDLLDQ